MVNITGNAATLGFEAKLWQMADKLRNNMDTAETMEDDGEPFDEKMKRLTATLKQQCEESAKLEHEIWKNLEVIRYGK